MKIRTPKMIKMIKRRAYLVVLGGILIHLSLGTLYTFGNMLPYLASYLAHKNNNNNNNKSTLDNYMNQCVWIYSFQVSGQALSFPLGGRLEQKLGPRMTALFGGWLMSIGVAVSYFSINNFYTLLLSYGLIFGLGVGIAYPCALVCGMKWWPSRPGIVNGFIVGGFGAGAFFFNIVQTTYVNPDNVKWDSDIGYMDQNAILNRLPKLFLLLAACYSIMQLIGSLLLINPPKDYALLGDEPEEEEEEEVVEEVETETKQKQKQKQQQQRDTESPLLPTQLHDDTGTENFIENNWTKTKTQHTVNEGEHGNNSISTTKSIESSPSVIAQTHPYEYDVKTIVQTITFWQLMMTFFMNTVCTTFISTQWKVFGSDYLNINNDRFLSIVGSVSSLFNASGRIFWGMILDKNKSHKQTMCWIIGIQCIFLATYVLCRGAPMYMFPVWTCVMYSCLGGNFSVFPTSTTHQFGPKHNGVVYGFIFFGSCIANFGATALQTVLLQQTGWLGLLAVSVVFGSISWTISFFFKPMVDMNIIENRKPKFLRPGKQTN